MKIQYKIQLFSFTILYMLLIVFSSFPSVCSWIFLLLFACYQYSTYAQNNIFLCRKYHSVVGAIKHYHSCAVQNIDNNQYSYLSDLRSRQCVKVRLWYPSSQDPLSDLNSPPHRPPPPRYHELVLFLSILPPNKLKEKFKMEHYEPQIYFSVWASIKGHVSVSKFILNSSWLQLTVLFSFLGWFSSVVISFVLFNFKILQQC